MYEKRRMLFKPRTHAWFTILMALAVAGAVAANHIRVMVVSQSGSNGNTITLRVDFNYSGDCCGGIFNWNTGDGRLGAVEDGIVDGDYQGDASGNGLLSNGDPFTWTRFLPDPNVPLVRIEITYNYANPGVYTVTWNDCCPFSEGATPVVVGGGGVVPTTKILAIDIVGNNNLENAFAGAAIPMCPGGPPLCYDLVAPADFGAMTQTQLDAYKIIVVGSHSDVNVIANLNLQKNKLITWTVNGGGLIAYAQLILDWGWIPNLGGSQVMGVASIGEDVSLTPKGVAHPSHINQIANGPDALKNWGPSRENYFTQWPGYFNNAMGGPLSVDDAGNAITLAGKANDGCVFLSGQPVDERAANGVRQAREMFRSSINYALNCPA